MDRSSNPRCTITRSERGRSPVSTAPETGHRQTQSRLRRERLGRAPRSLSRAAALLARERAQALVPARGASCHSFATVPHHFAPNRSDDQASSAPTVGVHAEPLKDKMLQNQRLPLLAGPAGLVGFRIEVSGMFPHTLQHGRVEVSHRYPSHRHRVDKTSGAAEILRWPRLPRGMTQRGSSRATRSGCGSACPRPQESGGRGDGYGLPTVSALAPR